RDPLLRAVQNLSSQTGSVAIAGIGLPSVDEPRLNLQFVGGKPLDPDTIEEPGCVRRYIRRLISPVIEVPVAEDSRVDVETMVHVEVVPAVGFTKVLIRATKVPLTASHAAVIPGRRD